MRLIQLLNEATVKRIGTNKSNSASFFYSTGRSAKLSLPHTIILSQNRTLPDFKELKDSDEFDVVEIKTTKVKKLLNDLVNTKYNDKSDENDDQLGMILSLIQGVISNEKLMELDPSMFKVSHLKSRASLYRYVTTHHTIDSYYFEKYFGDVPEALDDESVSFHNARIFVPNNMSKRALNSNLAVLESAYTLLEEHNLEWLIQGTIRFQKLPKNVGGSYNLGTGELNVAPNMQRNSRTIFTLLHELGHKLEWEFLDSNLKDVLEKKYEDLLHYENHRYEPTMEAQMAMIQAMEAIQPGMEFKYVGRKSFLSKDKDYVVTKIEPIDAKQIFMVHAANTSNPEKTAFTIQLEGLFNQNRFKLPDSVKIPSLELHDYVTDGWFVSDYAMTNRHEWWAEIFAFYTMDKLKDEPKDFVRTIIESLRK